MNFLKVEVLFNYPVPLTETQAYCTLVLCTVLGINSGIHPLLCTELLLRCLGMLRYSELLWISFYFLLPFYLTTYRKSRFFCFVLLFVFSSGLSWHRDNEIRQLWSMILALTWQVITIVTTDFKVKKIP